MQQHLLVAAIQITSTQEVSANLQRAEKLIRAAAAAGAELIALPENFAFMGAEREVLRFAQPISEHAFVAPLRQLASQLRVHILAGSVPETGPDAQHVYNTSVLIDAQGQTAAAYRKIHLFDVQAGAQVYQESAQVAPGSDLRAAAVLGWHVGLSVCYDLRFPELYRGLSQGGAHLLTVPAAFTLHTGKDHWQPLLQARAIENQCYVLAPAQFGVHSAQRSTWGKSMIVDPWGTTLAVAPESEGFISARVDAAYLNDVRTRIPALTHRRLG